MSSSAGVETANAIVGPLADERMVLRDGAMRLARLAAVDFAGFTREQLADHSLAMISACEQVGVPAAHFVAVAQNQVCALTKGHHSMSAALNVSCKVSRRRAAQYALIGSAKDRYRLFYESLLAGRIGLGHIEAVHPVWRAVDRCQFNDAEAALVELAELCTPEEFANYLAEWRNHADEDKALDEYIRKQTNQHFQYGFDLFGNVHYSGTVAPEHAEPFIETIETEANNHRDQATRPSHARGDALVELVLNPDGKYRARLEVLVPEHGSASTGPLSERIRHPFDRGFSTIFYPRTARGTLIPRAIVSDIRSRGARVNEHSVNGAGTIVADRHAGRSFTTKQRRLIRLRDTHCQHRGCSRLARSCEYDHIEPHDHGGPSLIRNGQLLCRFHHRWKHRDDPGPNRPTIFDDRPVFVQLE